MDGAMCLGRHHHSVFLIPNVHTTALYGVMSMMSKHCFAVGPSQM